MTTPQDPPPLTEEKLTEHWNEANECRQIGFIRYDVKVEEMLLLLSELRRSRARIQELTEEADVLREERDAFRYQALIARQQP